jgi:hypothetical protein
MIPDYKARRLARRILRDRVKPDLELGDVIGPVAIDAAKGWIPWTFKGVPTPDRWVAAVIQKESGLRGINAGSFDAFYGPQTQDAALRIQRVLDGVTAPLVRADEVEGDVSSARSGIRCWSPTTAEFRARYGREGENQALVRSPYMLRLDWDLEETIWKFSAHQSLVSRMEAALADVLAHYGIDQIRNLGLDRFGGCLNVRLKRGGSTPSVHSWGAAKDWYPSRNQLKQTRKSALFAKEAYAPFMDIWEKHGFMSLGRCFDFDWMHLQANP